MIGKDDPKIGREMVVIEVDYITLLYLKFAVDSVVKALVLVGKHQAVRVEMENISSELGKIMLHMENTSGDTPLTSSDYIQ